MLRFCQGFFDLAPAMTNAKGVLQNSPPTRPNIANCQSGSEPDAPKELPKTGISRVMYEIINNIRTFNLVASDARTPIRAGVIEAILNSHKDREETHIIGTIINTEIRKSNSYSS